uniref:Uncharacterized protein n=1 Tax=Parascaris univalens TaxID=6257 RepID=A0A915B491_PARUN
MAVAMVVRKVAAKLMKGKTEKAATNASTTAFTNASAEVAHLNR